MATESTIEVLQGELERLFELDELVALTADVLGFDPEQVGDTESKGAFARSLVGYCADQEAIDALVDAILLSSEHADVSLRETVRSQPNGELKPGTRVGDMRVVKKIGEGGLSIVYLAELQQEGEDGEQGSGGRRAALKVIRPQYSRDPAAVHRFTTVSRVMQRLQAPGLAPILSVGRLDDARPFVAAEYLTGQTLADRIKRTGSLHINEARPIFQGVLDGLKALHARGLVHGDVKAENVFVVRPNGEEGRSEPTGVLVDGGADRLLTRGGTATATVTGLLPVLGTAKAVAPEQARGAELDARTDIYQLGTLMYEVLAGQAPFSGETSIDVIAQHLSAEPEPPSKHARKGWVNESLDALVLKALAKDAAERFQSVAELAEALSKAGEKVAPKKPLDEAAYGQARRALSENPADTASADTLEQLAAESGAWSRVAEALLEAGGGDGDADAHLSLLQRAARIYDTELKEPARAAGVYEQILEIDSENPVALRGLEAARRATGDHEGLLSLLLDRVEREEDADARQALLREVASIYDEQLDDVDNALVAYAQALISDPRDRQAIKQVERLAGNDQARWGEILEMLSQAAQETQNAIFSDDDELRAAAQAQLDAAQTQLDAAREAVEANQAARREQAQAEAADRDAVQAEAEQALTAAREQLDALQGQLEQAAEALSEATQQTEAQSAAAEEAHAAAEAKVEEYETLEQEAGEEPSDEQVASLEELAEAAEQLVEAATVAEAKSEDAVAAQESARAQVEQAQREVDEAAAQVQQAEEALAAASPEGELPDAGALTEEEQSHLEAAEAQVQEAQQALAAFETEDQEERDAQRERDLEDLAETYVLMGRWYGDRIARPDFALSCFTQALTLDEAHAGAYDAVIDLYRGSQSWNELASALLHRAEQESSPVKARDYRTEAAAVIAGKLGDPAQARQHLEHVLSEDPAHPRAQEALGDIVRDSQDWSALAELDERRLEALQGEDRVGVLSELAQLYEHYLEDLGRAAACYEELTELEPRDLDALKGLERVYTRKENYEGLLENLRAQVDLAPTPRQRLGLLERIGALLEEEFVNHGEAAQAYEEIVAIDAANEAANVALARLYRHLQRFEDLVEALDRHAVAVEDASRKIELMLQAARTLAVDMGSPERAIDMYEEVLSIDDEHPEALSEIARLKSVAGDAAAAVAAVERLAGKEANPEKQAELWIRAGNMLAEAGDRDSAITRYKKALDLNPQASEAAEAMREIYVQRGDWRGAAEMLIHAIELADGDLKRAALLAELGVIYRDNLHEDDEARDAFEAAIEMDSTNTHAAAGLARYRFHREDNQAGVEYYEEIEGRLDELDRDGAAELCTEAAEAYLVLGKTDEAVAAFDRARELLPDDLRFAERHAAAVAESGDAATAERLYERILKKFDEELGDADRLRLTLALGEAQLENKRGKRAIETFKGILEQRPEDPDALDALTRAHEAAREWSEVVNLLQLRAKRARDDDEMFELLVKTGDVFLEHVRDRDAASQTYVMALDVKPDDRNLLSKLMGVYSDAKDWPRLIEVILRIADMVEDDAQLAKYYNTAASIAHLELGRFDEAANYYEEALAHMPADRGDEQFEGLVQCLTENQDWDRLEGAYQKRIDTLREAEGVDPTRIAGLLDARAEVIQNRLGRLADALALYEEALALEPEDEQRRQMLTAMYTKEPKRFFDRAVAAHRHYLDVDPYRIESLQSLRKIYTSGKRPDESWCMCQALRCLKMADADEEKFFKKYRLSRLAKMKQPVTDELWRELVIHPVQDPQLTAIFATVMPAVVATQSQKLGDFGISERERVDPVNAPTAMARMLAHVAENTTTHLPPVYDVLHDAGGLSFLFTNPPAIGVGQGAKAGGPQQALAFVAARHLSYFRPGHYVRQIVPTGTGLRAWLLGAIRMVMPKFPVPPAMEQQVKEAVSALGHHLSAPQRDALRSLTQKLLEAAPELDMKAWMAGVDLTADRIGFVLSNDLKIANAVIEASPEDASSIGRKDRMRELLAYSTSEPYFELRKRVGIALGG
ncbi:MAG: protein kinase [Myxococcales bacterium]|jgi:serine/threonine protein kinase/Flp pilus assembly protein TadD